MMWRTVSRILFGLYFACVGVLCFANFGSLPGASEDLLGIPTDKVIHFLMFCPFPLLAGQSIPKVFKSVRLIFLVLVAGVIFAASTEIIQYFIPYREGNWFDLLADVLGMLASTSLPVIRLLRSPREAGS